MKTRSEFERIIDEIEACIDGGGDIPFRLNRKKVREILEELVALYNSGKI